MSVDSKIKVWLFVGCVFLFLNSSLTPAQNSSKDRKREKTQTELLDHLLKGFQIQRERLQSGVFKVDAVLTFPQETTPDGSRSISLNADCFFSNHFQKFRFDQNIKHVKTNHKNKNKNNTRTDSSKYIRTPEYSIHTEGNNTSVRINEPEFKPYGYFSPFDIRVVGLINDAELLHGMTHSGNQWFLPGVLKIYQKYKLDKITLQSEGVYQISWFSRKSKEFKHVLWIDEGQGFSPTKMFVYRKTGIPKTFEVTPVIQNEITWKKDHNIWVPARLKIESRFNHKQLDMKFSWLKINQPVSSSLFTVEGLELPVGRRIEDDGESGIIETSIIDHRGGKKVLIKGGSFIPDKSPIKK